METEIESEMETEIESKTKRVPFTISTLTHRKLKMYAAHKGTSVNTFFTKLLSEKIEEYEKENFTPEFVTGINTQLLTESN